MSDALDRAIKESAQDESGGRTPKPPPGPEARKRMAAAIEAVKAWSGLVPGYTHIKAYAHFNDSTLVNIYYQHPIGHNPQTQIVARRVDTDTLEHRTP